MPPKTAEDQIRLANEQFEEQNDYTNPFAGLGAEKTTSLEEITKALRQSPPTPVSAQTKPPSALPEDTDDESDKEPSPKSKSVGKKAAKPPKPKSGSKKSSTVPAVSAADVAASAKKVLERSKGQAPDDTGDKKRVEPPLVPQTVPTVGSAPARSSEGASLPSKTAPETPLPRRSSELSPFVFTQSRMHGVVPESRSSPAGVRIGGVSSPPASDAASIAGQREDEEDSLDDDLGDPEDLMSSLATKPKSAVKPKSPVAKTDKGPAHKRGSSVLSSASAAGAETVVVSSHEIRISALEQKVAELIEQNKMLVEQNNTLADKTDALIEAIARLKGELIMEINEKTRRVGGPSPVVTVTSPSPITPLASAPVPPNIVPSATAPTPVASAVDPSLANLTGDALKRYLRRTMRQ